MPNTNEKLKTISNDLKGFLLVEGGALPPADYHKIRMALDCVDYARANARAREIQEAREMERRALALAEEKPEPVPSRKFHNGPGKLVEKAVVTAAPATFGVKGCPE